MNSNQAAENQAELDRLTAAVKLITSQLEASNERVRSLERANESIQDEYTVCLDRNTKLLADLKHKETIWEARISELTKQGSFRYFLFGFITLFFCMILSYNKIF